MSLNSLDKFSVFAPIFDDNVDNELITDSKFSDNDFDIPVCVKIYTYVFLLICVNLIDICV